MNGIMPYHRPSTVRSRTELYQDAVAVVATNYARDIELDDVAREVASSRRQLQRVFAEVGGTTFRWHLAKIRMQQAAQLLRQGELTVREVAMRVGYRQPAQFAKAFRRHMGQTPKDYRRLHGGMARVLH